MQAISVEGLWKQYRYGSSGYATLRHDLESWWARLRGREDPNAVVGDGGGAADAPGATGKFWALQDVSFSVEGGEVVGIIGRNGAGKSTLLKVMSRVTAPTRGFVRLRGRVSSLLEVGTGFHPELTGRENVYLNGAILGMSRAEIRRKFEEIVEFAELSRFIDTPVKRYSSGMEVRLAFAVAAHLDPEVLVVDEVLAVGDIEFQKKCLKTMQSVSGEGRTVLLVSHNMQSVAMLAGRCLLLERGRLAYDGAPGEAIERYAGLQGDRGGDYLAAPLRQGAAGVTRVGVVTSEANAVHRHGEPLRIEVEVAAPEPLEEPNVSIQVCDVFQQPIIWMWSLGRSDAVPAASGRYRFVCTLPATRLYLGAYTLTVHYGERHGKRNLQRIERICPFEVVMHGHEHSFTWYHDACKVIDDFTWAVEKIG